MKKKYHWIDENIKLNFEIPKGINNIITELEKLDLEENYTYFNWTDVLDCRMKEYVISGKLTNKQRDEINNKYQGW